MPRPRRSHTLGACRTCRRRHVKCDQKRPACGTCRTLGVPCEGFANEVRWMRDGSDDGDDGSKAEEQQGARRHLYTEQLRQSMSTSLGSNLVSGSISASLAEIDLKTRDAEHPGGDIVIGPFGVLDFGSTQPQEKKQDSQKMTPKQLEPSREAPHSPPQTASTAGQEIQELPTLVNDSPSYIDDFLHWSDILGLSPEQPGFFQPSMLDLDTYLADPIPESFDVDMNVETRAGPRSMAIPTPPSSAMEMASTFLDAAALADAPYLFKHFNENVVPQMMIMPLGDKSPWRILNLSAAMATYNELTILGSQSISHARLANLYALLACSAAHLSISHGSTVSTGSTHWQQASGQMFEQARDHMQKSLKLETREPKRAKYKDQLMAICCLIQYTVISGQQQHGRSFMVNAEYILRMRGLLKHRISQKSRLLHHVYTWLRLVGESTYVLHDYNPSSTFIEALKSNFQRPRVDPIVDSSPELNPRLDDFLRLEAHDADSDLNINEPKDEQTGLHDIHLQDSRSFSNTLYKQVYGIPETWLSLLSQTTRLANVMETFRIAQQACGNTSLDAWETLHRRSVRLENLICSCDLSLVRDAFRPHDHMLRALNAALVIFFYRRIRRLPCRLNIALDLELHGRRLLQVAKPSHLSGERRFWHGLTMPSQTAALPVSAPREISWSTCGISRTSI
ncbi:hypothetical protein AN9013.2 [Aspergillus nidulans FGSC A4]|uniref:Zn(II)2Cys6 transcription factor, putative (Eurofung) n=1 Tax=Emericella nidulans (strain FGSC A4 / ATCC 38163 / CBS 112.46 / NRRL 194 / M139) TaxID=227321 RepID=Q5ARR7_EMENI|nr:hypothetical protein [Aspergillus nidulans FGSC A4]EAA64345.1 hypothetical protein AN9013.2 [Aspergillus nidulans FGSC A4]CBF84461.1 TPA: Putative Zn(II)2Cys6 transcription factor, putative (Eurofung) [Aspergillus nidulans FGSC A4]|eukprot:XP_682282.1 hypothetical protein AN9013.2 [Aspergillus nidulans FGSC A4]